MSNFKPFQLPFIFFLLFTSFFTQNSSAFGSQFVQNRSFNRPDPLRHLKFYKGGYDIRNRHYWASAAFTGIHGYAMAGIWMVFGLGFGSYLMLKGFNGGFHPFLDHPSSYYLCFALIAVFTSIAISLNRSKNLMDTIFGAASIMEQTIEAVIQGLIKIQTLLQPYDPSTAKRLNQITKQMRKETTSIQDFVEEAKQSSNHAMKAVYISNLVFVTVNLVVLVAGCVVLFLHWHPGFIIFAGDTCSAFETFEQSQSPGKDNIMSIMSSCSNSSTADKFMAQIGYTVHKYINESNSEITSLVRKMLQPNEQNDEESLVIERICDPFGNAPTYAYTPANCPPDAIQIHDLPSILTTVTCEKDTPTQTCITEGRFFPEASYGRTMAYIQSITSLIATYPDLQSLARCTPLKQAISDIAMNQCKPFRNWVRLLWAFILSLSIDMMMLTFLWIVKAYQEKGKHFTLCSIVPTREVSRIDQGSL
ncbi:hypothetical protein OSB04_007618 [Centaurea solstitialis]|uniref:Odorant receptor n=1 Tax=Centaurea solstitialis TaxID=347529 RepID=A0AA38TSS1_9ASTR|nr:hypothetical protein OSB04_007618 [Centaurea solstitialis]